MGYKMKGSTFYGKKCMTSSPAKSVDQIIDSATSAIGSAGSGEAAKADRMAKAYSKVADRSKSSGRPQLQARTPMKMRKTAPAGANMKGKDLSSPTKLMGLVKKKVNKELKTPAGKMAANIATGGLASTSPAKGKRGLWDNIHAKRKRIKSGSGEKMRKPGSKGAPTSKALKQSQSPAKAKGDQVIDGVLCDAYGNPKPSQEQMKKMTASPNFSNKARAKKGLGRGLGPAFKR